MDWEVINTSVGDFLSLKFSGWGFLMVCLIWPCARFHHKPNFVDDSLLIDLQVGLYLFVQCMDFCITRTHPFTFSRKQIYTFFCSQELYHESHALDRFEQDYRRKQQEEDNSNAVQKGELLLR